MNRSRFLIILLTIILSIGMIFSYTVFADPTGGDTGSGTDQGTGGQDQGGSGGQDQGGTGGQDQGSTGSGTQTENGNTDTDKENDSDKEEKSEESNRRDTGSSSSSGGSSAEEETNKTKVDTKNKVSIIFSGDMHSHLESVNGMGGFARLKTTIDDVTDDYPDSFIFDAGDFSMGTPFQTIFMSEASELKMMGYLGYDVTTFGNHEFDYKPAGLAKMLKEAAKEQETTVTKRTTVNEETNESTTETVREEYMPEIVSSNIDWSETLSDESLKKNATTLKKAMDKYGVQDYTVIKKGETRIAVFGVMGDESISNAPECGVKWDDYIDRAKEVVEEIKRNDEADMIVCLSHSGYYEEEGNDSEDVKLAEEVPDIDLIISAHAHTALKEPVTVGDTTIAASGEYTNYLGHLIFKKTKDGYELDEYELKKMDDDVKKDSATESEIDSYKSMVDSQYFSDFDYSYDEELAESDFDFISLEDFEEDHGDNNLGDIISDSYIYAVKEAEGKDYEDVTCAVVPNGVVRGTFTKGEITVADAFNVSSLGIGPDGVPGYPLVSCYLTGREIKNLCEVDVSISPSMPVAILHMSGIKYAYNDHRLFLNRAIDIRIDDGTEEGKELDNDKLYRVVGGLYSLQMMGTVEEESKGLLKIKPKDKDGNEIEDYEKYIVTDDGDEVKEWYALASYIDSFDDNEVPEKYESEMGRKVDKTGFNPWNMIKQPNHYGVMLLCLILIPIVIIIGIILWIRKRKLDRKGYRRNMFGKDHNKRRSIFRSKRMGISRGRRNRF